MKGLHLLWTILALTAILTQQVGAQQINPETQRILASKFKSYQIIDNGTNTAITAAKQGSPLTLRFSLDGATTPVTIALEPNDLRDPAYRAVVTTARGDITLPRSEVKWFKGYVNGDTRAIARITLEAAGPAGFFFLGNRQQFIEPLARHCPASPGLLIVYDAADVLGPHVRCDANEIEQYRAAARQTAPARQTSDTLPPLNKGVVLKLATEADYTYYSHFKTNTNDHILGVINQVDGLYEKDFGVNFKVTYQHVFQTKADDPYPSSDPLTLLEKFRDYWNANHAQVDRHIAFLFNAVDLSSGALGRAYEGQACTDVTASYGFFSYTEFIYEASVVAHEIGHTLHAEHETSANCQAEPSLMCAAISRGTPFKFSTIAQTAIATYLSTHTCFTAPLQVRIHPIPTIADLIVETSSLNFTTTLYDLLGREVGVWTSTTSTTTIPTDTLTSGFYLLRITSGSQTSTHRVEIMH